MRKKRIKQVRTKRPIKVLFLGLSSKTTPLKMRIAECRMRNINLLLQIPHPEFRIQNIPKSATVRAVVPTAIRIPQYYLKTAPTGIECPARNSRTLILLFPSNWTSLIIKEAFPVSTSMKSDPTQETIPVSLLEISSLTSPL